MTHRRRVTDRLHPEIAYGGFTDIDGTLIFYARVRELLAPDAVALDVGCGRGTQGDDPVRVRRDLRILRGRCRRVIGIDVDREASRNPFVDEFRMINENGLWPVESASIDLALADFVLEHVVDPSLFMSEAARVLRPGGTICIRTINSASYFGLASRILPNRLHVAILSRIQPWRPVQDVFPTLYRCNTRSRLQRELREHRFEAVVYGSEDEPAYLRFNAMAYRLGLAHRRFAPSGLRCGLIAWGFRR